MDDIVTWLRSILHNDRSVELHCKQAADEIVRLRKELDDARQEICIRACDTLGAVISGSPASPQDYAEDRGWDCFKENTDG